MQRVALRRRQRQCKPHALPSTPTSVIPFHESDVILPPDNQMEHGRRIPNINALLLLPISLQSGLTRPEGCRLFTIFCCFCLLVLLLF